MKNSWTTILLLIFAIAILNGEGRSQTTATQLDPTDQRKAIALAVEFVNEFRATEDLRPLIPKYFVADFPRRLEFCRTTSNCEGSARDFWKGPEESDKLRLSREDYFRHYVSLINGLLLYSQAANNLAIRAGKKPDAFDDEAEKIINERLRSILKKNATWRTIWGMEEGEGDDGPKAPETAQEYRKSISDHEQTVAALRKVAAEARQPEKGKRVLKPKRLLAETFTASLARGETPFFDFPADSIVIRVWPEIRDIPFVIDVIKVGNQMKIVAVYPPID